MIEIIAAFSSITWPGAFAIVGISVAFAYLITKDSEHKNTNKPKKIRTIRTFHEEKE